MKAYDLNVHKQAQFSKYNSIGTALALKYVALGLPVKNIDILISDREGKSRFGGM